MICIKALPQLNKYFFNIFFFFI